MLKTGRGGGLQTQHSVVVKEHGAFITVLSSRRGGEVSSVWSFVKAYALSSVWGQRGHAVALAAHVRITFIIYGFALLVTLKV